MRRRDPPKPYRLELVKAATLLVEEVERQRAAEDWRSEVGEGDEDEGEEEGEEEREEDEQEEEDDDDDEFVASMVAELEAKLEKTTCRIRGERKFIAFVGLSKIALNCCSLIVTGRSFLSQPSSQIN